MKFSSLQPFVPSGKDFEGSRAFFTELGFSIAWEADGYIGFRRDGCSFILQKFDNRAFAENFMISVAVDNVNALWEELTQKKLPEKYGISLGEPADQPYGREVNIIDLAGVCWHFVQVN